MDITDKFLVASRRIYRDVRWGFVATPPSVGDVFEVSEQPDAGKGVGVVSCKRVIDALGETQRRLWTDVERGGPWIVRFRVSGCCDEGPYETYSQRAEVTGVADATKGLDEVIGHWVASAAAQYADEPHGIPASIMTTLAFRRRWAAGGISENRAWDVYLGIAEVNRKPGWMDWAELVETLALPAPDWEMAKSILSACGQILIRYQLGYTGYVYDRKEFARRATYGDPLMTEAFRDLESTIDWHLQGAIEAGMPALCDESTCEESCRPRDCASRGPAIAV